MNQCDMVSVQTLKLGPYPEIGPITLADPMRVVAWTKDGLSAAHGSMIRAAGTRISGMFGDPNGRSSTAKPVPTALTGGERRRLRACALQRAIPGAPAGTS
jgi:hypothetical protein